MRPVAVPSVKALSPMSDSLAPRRHAVSDDSVKNPVSPRRQIWAWRFPENYPQAAESI
jgi:hypothetical protein